MRKNENLTVEAVDDFTKKAKPGEKIYDGGGLHLFMLTSGNATWRVRYRIYGSERSFSIGVYPHIGIKKARAETCRVKRLVRRNINPVDDRRKKRIASRAEEVNMGNSKRPPTKPHHGNEITDQQLMDMASFISAWHPYRRKELVMLIMSVDIGKSSIEQTLFGYMTKLQEAKEENSTGRARPLKSP